MAIDAGTPGPDLWRGLISRRAALAGLGAFGLGAALTGCRGSRPVLGPAAAGPDYSDIEKVVNWSNWPDYIDTDSTGHPTLRAFTRATGVTVNYTEDYQDNEEFFAQVRPQLAAGQELGRDVWCSTDWMVARLIRLGYLQKLDRSVITNAGHLQSSLRQAAFDPGRQYSLPWQSGFTGIGFNPKSTGGRSVDSVDQLLTDPALKGRVTLLTEMQDTVGLTMLDMGIDPASFTDADFGRAMNRLTAAKEAGQIKAFTGNDYTRGLASGTIAACLAYTGDIVQLQASQPALGYRLPAAGHVIWSDNFVIPQHARHKRNAERLINFYYDPVQMAAVEEAVNYISPVDGSRAVLLKTDPRTAGNVLIFPTAAVLARAHTFRGLTADEDARYNAAFAQLIGT